MRRRRPPENPWEDFRRAKPSNTIVTDFPARPDDVPGQITLAQLLRESPQNPSQYSGKLRL